MRFEVELTAVCIQELDEVHEWIAAGSRQAADRWICEMQAELETLAVFPKRCPLAPEAAARDIEFRHLLCGDYRIVFRVEGRTVYVEHVRHGARTPLAEET